MSGGETKQQLSNLIAENAYLRGLVADLSRKPTIRDKFAMAALPGIISRNATYFSEDSFNLFSDYAYGIADAMLKMREGKDVKSS